MSMKAFRWAKAQEGLTSAEKFVLIMLGDYYNDEWHRSWPSYGSLARDTSLSLSTVQRAVRSLRAAGLIDVEAWVLNEGAVSMPNRYLLTGYRRDVQAATYQPVVVSAYSGLEVYDDLIQVPGSNLYIEANALDSFTEVESG
jgi:pyocin large subunit-like protein